MANDPNDEQIRRLIQKLALEEEGASVSKETADASLLEMGLDGENLFDVLWSPYLSKDLTDDLLIAYAKGEVSEEERATVEAMIQIEPSLMSAIAGVRDEISQAREATTSKAAERESSFWRWLCDLFAAPTVGGYVKGTLLVGAAAAIVGLFIVVRRDASSQLAAANAQLAALSKSERDNEALMQKTLDENKSLRSQHLDDQKRIDLASKPVTGAPGEPRPLFIDNGHEKFGWRRGLVKRDLGDDLGSSLYLGKMEQLKYPSRDQTSGEGSNFPLGGQPMNTKVDPVLVRFRWNAPKGVAISSYVVKLISQSQEQILLDPTTKTFVTSKSQLELGTSYRWSVLGTTANGVLTSSEGWFQTLTKDESKMAAEVRADKGDDHLDRAIRFGRLGLRDEARNELDQIKWLEKTIEVRFRKTIIGE